TPPVPVNHPTAACCFRLRKHAAVKKPPLSLSKFCTSFVEPHGKRKGRPGSRFPLSIYPSPGPAFSCTTRRCFACVQNQAHSELRPTQRRLRRPLTQLRRLLRFRCPQHWRERPASLETT